MKVIGAGFGRTGTLSLKVALEELGFKPCYHMMELITKHREHAALWLAAFQRKPVDWKSMLAEYQACVDWPSTTFYKELMEVYPDAKVLLSVRDPGKWYESVTNTIFRVSTGIPKWVKLAVPALGAMGEMSNALIWEGTFGGKFLDRDHAIAVFNRHIEEVKRTVPPERLLVYDVKQGWEPLCQFLGVPVPKDKPFPRVNDTVEFNKRIERRKRIMQGVLAALVALLGWAVYLVVR
jgi:hypothetical protein